MTLEEKLQRIKEGFPEIYEAICVDAPSVVNGKKKPTARDIDHYNFWVDGILNEDAAQELYEI